MCGTRQCDSCHTATRKFSKKCPSEQLRHNTLARAALARQTHARRIVTYPPPKLRREVKLVDLVARPRAKKGGNTRPAKTRRRGSSVLMTLQTIMRDLKCLQWSILQACRR